MAGVIPAQSFFKRTRLYDTMRNFLSGIGVADRDKVTGQRFVLEIVDVEQLEAAYRGDWISRKVVDIPAFDACRKWRNWKAEQDQIEKIEKVERAFGLQRKLMDGIAKARLYGGAALLMGVRNQDFREELRADKVGKDDLAFVHVCTRYQIQAGPLVRDITSPWFGEPEYYMRSDMPITGPLQLKSPDKQSVVSLPPGLQIHPSRVVRLIGNEYPDMERAPDSWGDSSLQPVIDAVKNAGLVSGSIAALTAKANVDVIKVPGLTQALSTDGGTKAMVDRWSSANVAKSVVNALLIDDEEEWQQLQVTFSGMPQVLQMYLAIAAGAADIPATRLLGKSPEGMNATGDSDIRNYYDRLQSDQAVRMTPLMSRLDEVMLRSIFGERDEDIYFEWAPLWQMDEEQESNVALRKAQAFKIDVDAGLTAPDALRKARENQLIEDGTYPGLDAAIKEAEEAAAEEVPEEAMAPHPAIREKINAREQAQQRFEAQQEQMRQQPPPFFGAKGNGLARDSEIRRGLRDVFRQARTPGVLGFSNDSNGSRQPGAGAVGQAFVSRVGAADWNPDQPREPEGNPEGGQWTAAGGSVGGGESTGESTAGGDENLTINDSPEATAAAKEFGFSRMEQHAFYFYTGGVSGYHARGASYYLNRFYRQGRKGENFAEGTKKELNDRIDALNSALKKSVVPSTFTCYRGISTCSISRKLSADHNAEKLKGKVVPLGGFQSTSMSKKVAREWVEQDLDNVVLEITVEKGSHALWMYPFMPDRYKYAQEVVLGQGQLRIDGVRRGSVTTYIQGTYIEPK